MRYPPSAVLGLCLASTALLGGCVTADTVDVTHGDVATQEAVLSELNKTVSITRSEGTSAIGRLRSVSFETSPPYLQLHALDGNGVQDFAGPESMKVSERDHLHGALGGALLGALIGGVVGAALAPSVKETHCPPDALCFDFDELEQLGNTMAGAGLGMGVGILAGAVVGGAIGAEKTTIYRFDNAVEIAASPTGVSLRVGLGR